MEKLEKLTKESSELSKKLNRLSAEARAEPFMPKKEQLLKEKGEIWAKKSYIDSEREKIKAKIAQEKADKLIAENITDTYLYINNVRVKVNKDLTVEIPFDCHKHSLKLPLRQLFSHRTTQEGNPHYDLAQWTAILAAHETRTRQFLCPECMAEKRKFLRENHVASNKKTGIALVKLVVME